VCRFLFTVWPFVGHVNPFLGVARALRERGHAVAVYTGGSARGRFESEGIEVFPFDRVSEDVLQEIIATIERTPTTGLRALGALGPLIRVFREYVGTIAPQVADLRPIVERWAPDVIVSDPSMWGPVLVLSETSPVPVAILSTLLGCLIPGKDRQFWQLGGPQPRGLAARAAAGAVAALARQVSRLGYRPHIDRARAGFGLPPLGMPVSAYTARLPLYMVPSIAELDYDRDDLPPSVHYLGACSIDRPPDAAPPGWLEALPDGRPVVHATEGTLHYEAPVLLRAAAKGLGGLAMDVIMTTGADRDPESLGLGPIAPNIRVERFVSHSDLLPRCDVLLTTGGAGTVLTALKFGLPMVIVPTHFDKPANARRVVAAGAGLQLAPARCTPGRLREAVERVLHEPSFRRNARRLAERLAEHRGPARAAELLESLARPGAPASDSPEALASPSGGLRP
jgi:MGT family glycosyltransferase